MPAGSLARRGLITLGCTAASWVAWHMAVTPVRFVAALAVVYSSLWALAFLWLGAARRVMVFSLAAVHLVLGLAVAALEAPVALRLVDYRAVFHTPSFFFPTRDPNYQQDPELGYLGPANQRQRGDTPGNIAVLFRVADARTYPYDVSYDARGFRNPEALETTDIAMVGDSFVHGVFVPHTDLAASVLGRITGRTVYNLGQLAYGPQQEAAVIRRFAIPMRSRTIVWMFYEGNDLQDIAAFHEFERDYQAAVGKRNNFWARSFTRNVLATLGTLAGRTHASAEPRSALWTMRVPPERVYFLEPGEAWSAANQAALDEFRTIFEPVAADCGARGVRLVFAFAPTKYRVLHDQVSVAPGSDLESWVLSDLPDRLRALVAQMPGPVDYVDLTPPLVQRAAAGDLPYFVDDTHWNATGHDVVARTLAAVLTAPGGG